MHRSGILWPADSAALSASGESYVTNLLKKLCWNILDRNRRFIGTELDIIASKGGTLAVVEVKVRKQMPNTAADFTALLPNKKQAALIRGTRGAMSMFGSYSKTTRIDLALVVVSKLTKEKRPALQPDVFYFHSVISAIKQ